MRHKHTPRYRRVYFSFSYAADVWRASQVRNLPAVTGKSWAGFDDHSIWQDAETKRVDAIHRMIDQALTGTSVTVVLIGAETAASQFVNYEIEESMRRQKGMLGLRIHHLHDEHGKVSPPGPVPHALKKCRAEVLLYNPTTVSLAIERAAKAAGR